MNQKQASQFLGGNRTQAAERGTQYHLASSHIVFYKAVYHTVKGIKSALLWRDPCLCDRDNFIEFS